MTERAGQHQLDKPYSITSMGQPGLFVGEPLFKLGWPSAIHAPTLNFEAVLDRSPFTVRAATIDDADRVIGLLGQFEELSFTHRWEAGKVRKELLTGESPVAIAERNSELIGVGVAGIHGMRGIIHHVAVIEAERTSGVGTEIIKKLLAGLSSHGVRRIHVLVNQVNQQAIDFLTSLGFAVNDGEKFLQSDLVSPVATPRDLKVIPSMTLRAATPEDLPQIFELVANVPELAFQLWERELLNEQLRRPSNVIALLAVSDAGQICGVLIGGHNGVRGTINHIWVNEEHRGKKIVGPALLDQAVDLFERVEVKRLHIMLTPKNDNGYRFWSRVGFREIPGETFLEIDV